ncbi:diguanylate cyclase (GGDEF) domain-containing protein [Noviherbaspirillum humi]|uniref:diguanylate cyclase n=1 Tax=Noviherbaspirillum humi TaxID=1688639 RepID=A0A239LZW9_9BURK|nr:GGDEF domain-containing protein [Noviherbaspirillum humi]SNT36046.1 diguanylate cyclase (GGDEF) domain-containing protein [Noviherbaspirillum humi]
MLSTKEIFLIASLLCFVTFLVLFSFREQGVRGISQMLLASVLGMAGNILYAYGRELSPVFAYEIANAVYASASASALFGYRHLFRRPPHMRAWAVAIALLTVLIAWFHYVVDSFLARTLVASLFQAAVAAGIGFTVLHARAEWRRPYYPKIFILSMCLLISAGHLLRIMRQLVSAAAPASLLEPSSGNVLVLAAGAFALPVLILGGLLIAHRRIVLMAEHAANHDFLTGAFSRRAFFDIGGREQARTARTGQPVSLMLVDLDNFKPINDAQGHDAGDRVLQRFVELAQQELRSIDCLCRMGGDEFAVLMPETDLNGAMALANRIRHRMESSADLLCGVTLSIGVASLREEDSLQTLVKRADLALYAAKGKGRNQVQVEENQVQSWGEAEAA